MSAIQKTESSYGTSLAQSSANASSYGDHFLRASKVALPFLSMYRPIGQALSLVSGGIGSIACLIQLKDAVSKGDQAVIRVAMIQTAVAVTSFVCTIFAHPVGMILNTSHELVLNCRHLIEAIEDQDYCKAAEITALALNNLLYLGIFFTGAIEFTIAAYSIQALLGFYHSYVEFQKGNVLEAAGHLLMTCIRVHQVNMQIGALQMKWQLNASFKKMVASQAILTSDGHTKEESLVVKTPVGRKLAAVGGSYDSGDTLFAYRTEYSFYDGASAFIARYNEGSVVTILQDPRGRFIPGTQIALHGNDVISVTTNWTMQTINGLACLTHYHDLFIIYTIGESQRIFIR